jgi:branched-chain amino acid transport system permease protein
MSERCLRSRGSLVLSLLAPLALIGGTVLVSINGTPSLQDSVAMILASLIIVLGLQVFIGNSGVYSFGQLGFAAAGAYLTALLTLPAAVSSLQTPELPSLIATAHLGAFTATLVAGLAGAILAFLVGLPLMRTSTLAIPISTFAFLIVLYNVLANWDPMTGGSSGLVSIPATTSVLSAGAWAAVAVVVALTFKWSASGYRLQATREDEVAARSIGIVVIKERMIAFVLSGALCGIGGALAVHQSGVLNPMTFYFGATVTAVTMLVVGGARSVFGAVIGTLAVAGINELLRSVEDGADLFGVISIGYAPGLAAIGVGLILLMTMVALPDGLSSGREAGELAGARGLGRGRRSLPGGKKQSLAMADRPGKSQVGAALRAGSISVSFGGLHVLRGVDLEVGRGEILGLIGPNGAGKTTLVNVISGFQKPDAGTIELEGADVSGLTPSQLARKGLTRTFQAALPFSKLSGLENVAVGAMGVGADRRRSVAIATDVLERLGLGEAAHKQSGALTPAEQRLLGIARSLASAPRYLLLDEPAAGLNEVERDELLIALEGVRADFGCGIVLVEHDMSVVMGLCRRVQVIDDGVTLRIGSPEEIQRDPGVVEAYLGRSFTETDVA